MERTIEDVTIWQDKSLKSWVVDNDKLQLFFDKYELTEKNELKLKTIKKAVKNIINKKYHSYRTNHNRLYNPFVLLKSDMRKFITSPNDLLIQIDAANSHPVLLVNHLIDKGVKVENELVDLVKNGKFYNIFEWDRKETKKKVFQLFYNKEGINKELPIYKILIDKYPIFTKELSKLSSKNLSMQMQKIESDMWINTISKACMFAKIKHVTAHDSIIFEKKYFSIVKSIIDAAYKNISASFHIENLDKTKLELIQNHVDVLEYLEPPDELLKTFTLGEDIGFINILIKWNDKKKKLTNRLSFDKINIINYLKNEGFGLIETDADDYYIKNKNNIIREISQGYIKRYLDNFIKTLKYNILGYEPNYIIKLYHEKIAGSINSNNIFDYLSDKTNLIKKTKIDGADFAMIPFNNGVLKITKDSRKLIKYDNIDGLIWERNIKQINYKKVDTDNSEIRKYCMLITGENQKIDNINIENKKKQFNNIKSSIGYLIHNYKDISNTKMIVLMDTNTGNSNRGGAGKSLLAQLVGVMRNVEMIDGKDTDETFNFDGVNHSTEIVAIDDMKQYYNLEKLNVSISGTMIINSKYGKKLHIPFQESPKILGSSNYMIDTERPGVKRRLIIVEINDYFSINYTPIDEFGHRLIDDWSEEQLNIELNFLIEAVQQYFKDGLNAVSVKDSRLKLLDLKIGEDMTNAIEELLLESDHIKISKYEFRNQICDFLNLNRNNLTKKEIENFGRKLKTYCDLSGYELNNTKTTINNKRVNAFLIKKIDSDNPLLNYDEYVKYGENMLNNEENDDPF